MSTLATNNRLYHTKAVSCPDLKLCFAPPVVRQDILPDEQHGVDGGDDEALYTLREILTISEPVKLFNNPLGCVRTSTNTSTETIASESSLLTPAKESKRSRLARHLRVKRNKKGKRQLERHSRG